MTRPLDSSPPRLFITIIVLLWGTPGPAAVPAEPAVSVTKGPLLNSQGALGTVARDHRQALFIVGQPEAGYGTAFVISKRHRLLVTNAHVADVAHRGGHLYAIMNGTTSVYQVVRVWYHPGLMRYIGNSNLQLARSVDPADGNVHTQSPDVAVLQLSDEGLDLPMEFALAPPEAVDDLFARDVGMVGYPGHSTSWPNPGEAPNAVFHTGVISHQTNFSFGNSELHQKRQLLRHTITGGSGFSGSPVFDSIGRVIGVHNASQGTQQANPLGFAIRADAVWELLAVHGLLPLVAKAPSADQFDVEALTKPDPRVAAYRTIYRLVMEARELNEAGQHAEASQKCNLVIQRFPESPFPYLERAVSFVDYAAEYQDKIAREELRKHHLQARQDIARYRQQVAADPRGIRIQLQIELNLIYLDQMDGAMESARVRATELVPFATQIIQNRYLPGDLQTLAYSARAHSKLVLEDRAGSLADYNEAIQQFPYNPQAYLARGRFHESVTGNGRLAAVDFQRAKELMSQQPVG